MKVRRASWLILSTWALSAAWTVTHGATKPPAPKASIALQQARFIAQHVQSVPQGVLQRLAEELKKKKQHAPSR